MCGASGAANGRGGSSGCGSAARRDARSSSARAPGPARLAGPARPAAAPPTGTPGRRGSPARSTVIVPPRRRCASPITASRDSWRRRSASTSRRLPVMLRTLPRRPRSGLVLGPLGRVAARSGGVALRCRGAPPRPDLPPSTGCEKCRGIVRTRKGRSLDLLGDASATSAAVTPARQARRSAARSCAKSTVLPARVVHPVGVVALTPRGIAGPDPAPTGGVWASGQAARPGLSHVIWAGRGHSDRRRS
jgi:hypothetical protein